MSSWGPAISPPLRAFSTYKTPYKSNTHLEFVFAEDIEISTLTTNNHWGYGYTLTHSTDSKVIPMNCVQLLQTSTPPPPSKSHSSELLHLSQVVIRSWRHTLDYYLQSRNLPLYDKVVSRLSSLVNTYYEKMKESPSFFEEMPIEESGPWKEQFMEFIDEGNAEFSLNILPRYPLGTPITLLNTGVVSLFRIHKDFSFSKNEFEIHNTESSLKHPSLNLNDLAFHSPSSVKRSSKKGSDIRAPTLNKSVSKVNIVKSQSMDTISREVQTQKKDGSFSETGLCQLFFEIVFVMADVGSDFDLLVGLYDGTHSKYLTDQFHIKMGKHCQPKKLASSQNELHGLFRDIEPDDINNSLHLVVILIREGGFSANDGKKKEIEITDPLRRPYGMGVMLLDPADLFSKSNKEYTIPLFTTGEAQWHQLVDLLISGAADQVVCIQKAKGVVFRTRLYPGDYSSCLPNYPIISKCTNLLRREIPLMTFPGSDRNDIFFTLRKGEFSEKNIEVDVYVRSSSSRTNLKNVIFLGSTSSEKVSSCVLSGNNPHWNEVFKIQLEKEVFEKAHIYLEFRKRSTSDNPKTASAYAFTFLKLFEEDGSPIHNNTRTLPLYKSQMNKPIFYLKNQSGTGKPLKPLKSDTITVSTQLTSTLFPQDPSIVLLAACRGKFGPEVPGILKKMTFLNAHELVIHIELIFNNILQIFSHPMELESENNVFHTLVFLLGKFSEFHGTVNLRSIIKNYITEYITYSGYHTSIFLSLSRVLSQLDNPTQISQITSTMKVLDYLMMLIIQSRKAELSHPSEFLKDEQFKNQIHNFFRDELMNLIKSEKKTLIGAQVAVFKVFPQFLKSLSDFFTPREIASFSLQFFEGSHHLYPFPKISVVKFTLFTNVACGFLFDSEETRLQLIPPIVNELFFHLNIVSAPQKKGERIKKEVFQSRLAEGIKVVSVFGLLFDVIQLRASSLERQSYIPQILDVYPALLDFLKMVSSERKNFSSSDQAAENFYLITTLGNSEKAVENFYVVSVTALALIRLLDSLSLYSYLEKMPSFEATTYLIKILKGLQESASFSFPNRWGILVQAHFSLILKAIELISLSPHTQQIISSFGKLHSQYHGIDDLIRSERTLQSNIRNTTDPNFLVIREYHHNKEFIEHLLALLSIFISRKELCLDQVNSFAMKENYGDMRIECISHLREILLDLGPLYEFPSTLRLLCHMNLLMDGENAHIFLEESVELFKLFFNSDSGSSVTNSIIDILDSFFEEQRASYQDISTRVKTHFLDRLSGTETIGQYLSLVSLYFADRSSLSDISDPNDETQQKLAGSFIYTISRLMDFLLAIGRTTPYSKYAHVLSAQHIKLQNYTEAAMALMHHTSLLSWDNAMEMLDEVKLPGLDFPQQFVYQRKEALFSMCIKYLDQGKDWEKAIEMLNEMILFNEQYLFEYKKVAQLHRSIASFYQKIMQEERIARQYYRVGFYGKGFLDEISNLEFIYQAKPFERLGDFIERIKLTCPEAQLLRSTEKPGDDIVNSEGQHLLVTTASVSSEEERCSSSDDVILVQKLEAGEQVDVFVYSKPFNKLKIKTDNEFKDLWLRNTYFKTAEGFPCARASSKIIETSEIVIKPIGYAIHTVVSKTEELTALVGKYTEKPNENISPLSMALSGVIDAAVNGGIAKYQDAFFGLSYITENPKDASLVKILKTQLYKQMNILNAGLQIQDSRIGTDLRGFHLRLQENFDKLRMELAASVRQSTEQRRLSSSTPQHSESQPPPPLPASVGLS